MSPPKKPRTKAAPKNSVPSVADFVGMVDEAIAEKKAREDRAEAPAPAKPPTSREKLEAVGIDALCEFIATNGAEGNLNRFCQIHSVPYNTAAGWISEDGKRAEKYTRAREDRADALVDEIVAIADEECTMVKADKHNTPGDGDGMTEVVYDTVAVARNKMRIDARKWAASKLKPKAYGEKLAIGGAEDLPPVRHALDMSDEALLAIAMQAKPQ